MCKTSEGDAYDRTCHNELLRCARCASPAISVSAILNGGCEHQDQEQTKYGNECSIGEVACGVREIVAAGRISALLLQSIDEEYEANYLSAEDSRSDLSNQAKPSPYKPHDPVFETVICQREQKACDDDGRIQIAKTHSGRRPVGRGGRLCMRSIAFRARRFPLARIPPPFKKMRSMVGGALVAVAQGDIWWAKNMRG